MADSQVNLHNHSEGSYLDGYATVDDIVNRAVDLGQSAISITDHGECNQHLAFQKACRTAGIHPVFGMEGYWLPNIEDKKAVPNSHITLLAQDQRGLSNLWALSSVAYERKYFHKRPVADLDLLRTYAEGIYASDGCMLTDLGRAVIAGEEDRARQYMGSLLEVFGDRFFVELHTWQFMNPSNPEQIRLNSEMAAINQAKVRLATELGVPLVVVNDSHHARPEDWRNKELVWRFNTRQNADQLGDEGQKADHIMGTDELVMWMSRHGIGRSVVEEAIANSARIAESCTAEIKPTLELPRFTDSERDDMVKFLDLVEQGFRRKVIDAGLDAATYFQRMETETRLICDKQFAGYFLVVHDYVKAAKSGSWAQWVTPGADPDPLQVGPGRGSGGGSLVAWLLDITAIDPIRHDLLFERFLAPSRKGYPDIDTDFPRSKRPGLKAYLEARYGGDHVCTIGTTTRNNPKAMVRDLGRALDVPYRDVNEISNIIMDVAKLVADETEETGEEVSWDTIVSERGGDLAPWARKYPELFERLGQMVGIARQSGVHPSGVLVNSAPLLGLVPLRTRKHGTADEVTTTQFNMDEVEELGGVKFDLLGIRHLDTLDTTRRLVRQRHGVDLDFEALTDEQLADPAIWERIDRGRTTGVFQVETPGATRTAIDLKPRNVSDVAHLVSIIRPGVKDAGLTDEFLKRRSGEEPVVYDHPLMKPIVEPTYGILVYQEQMIRAARELASFTPDEADELRRITAKKKAELLGPWEKKFLDGCLNNPEFTEAVGTAERARQVASRIWASINASARYSFNKSHAVGYGLVATWEIFAAHYYEPEFLVALMQTDGESVNRYVREARRSNIKILPPDINLSEQKFCLTGDTIRYGIDTVMGVGGAIARDIQKNRPYTSLEDYLTRAGRGSHKSAVLSLIKIGAFDDFGSRVELLQHYQRYRILESVAARKRASLTPEQADEIVARKLTEKPEEWAIEIPDFADEDVVYRIEEELVGTYVTVDPMARYIKALDAVAIRHPEEMNNFAVGDLFVIGGQIAKVKEHPISKGRFKGALMAFLSITWNEEEFEVVAFPECWRNVTGLVTPGAPVACRVIRTERGCTLSSVQRLDLLFDGAEA
jgi:DNA polymerase-3 subunit alpha